MGSIVNKIFIPFQIPCHWMTQSRAQPSSDSSLAGAGHIHHRAQLVASLAPVLDILSYTRESLTISVTQCCTSLPTGLPTSSWMASSNACRPEHCCTSGSSCPAHDDEQKSADSIAVELQSRAIGSSSAYSHRNVFLGAPSPHWPTKFCHISSIRV